MIRLLLFWNCSLQERNARYVELLLSAIVYVCCASGSFASLVNLKRKGMLVVVILESVSFWIIGKVLPCIIRGRNVLKLRWSTVAKRKKGGRREGREVSYWLERRILRTKRV